MSATTTAFKMDAALEELKSIAGMFGVGDELQEEIEEEVETFADAGAQWARDTKQDWYDSAPWATGNLRESIDADTDDPTAPKVWVNPDRLTRYAGQYLPTVRGIYKKRGIKRIKMPNGNYLEQADEQAASASKTVDPIQPQSEREYATGAGTTPFLLTIWKELAKRNERTYFNE